MFRKVFFAASIALLSAVTAPAATITYTLDLSGAPGTFTLYADVSAGDNFGLVNFDVPLLGTVTNLDNVSPLTVRNPGFTPAGFGTNRLPGTGTDPVAGPVVNPEIRGSQDAAGGPIANFVYGMGQTAGTWPFGNFGAASDATSDQNWNAHLRLATGNYTGVLAFNLASTSLVGNVWLANDGTRTAPQATIQTQIIAIPEPATITLIGIALVGGLGLIRRRAA